MNYRHCGADCEVCTASLSLNAGPSLPARLWALALTLFTLGAGCKHGGADPERAGPCPGPSAPILLRPAAVVLGPDGIVSVVYGEAIQ